MSSVGFCLCCSSKDRHRKRTFSLHEVWLQISRAIVVTVQEVGEEGFSMFLLLKGLGE